jgi:hypothetical protein
MKILEPVSSADALQLLKEGAILSSTTTRARIFLKQGKIRVQAPHYFAALAREDFLTCYANEKWNVYQETEQIDEKKDQEYYAWRREKQ